MDSTEVILVGVFTIGCLVGAIVQTCYLYWSLATGRRTVRPWGRGWGIK